MAKITIVGGGIAAYKLIEALRKQSLHVPITVLTADGGDYYWKPSITTSFNIGGNESDIERKSREDIQREFQVNIVPHQSVTEILPDKHEVRAGGRSHPYEKLVLAMGARARHIPASDLRAGRTFYLNHFNDHVRLRSQLGANTRVLIIGAGMIGCEAASHLASSGHTVFLTDIANSPLSSLQNQSLSEYLAIHLDSLGVQSQFGVKIEAMEHKNKHTVIKFDDGEELIIDLVVYARGVEPRVEMIQRAGIGTRKGVVVDSLQRTTQPDLYAIGDVAEYNEGWMPYLSPIFEAAPLLASTLLDSPRELKFPPMPIRVKIAGSPLVFLPPSNAEHGAWEAPETQEGAFEQIFVDESGKISGFALSGKSIARQPKLLQHIKGSLT